MGKSYYSSHEIAEGFIDVGIRKTSNPTWKQFLYAYMAGMFLALVCASTNMAVHTVENYGLAKALSGAIFPAGLIIIILAGTELFTGNCLISISCLDKKVKWSAMAKNLVVVYFGNFTGSLLTTWLIALSGQWGTSGGALALYTVKTAVNKVTIDFVPALVMGILCNILVCCGVWLSSSSGDVAGKILAMFFPIWVFVISGYEHSVANMYYIPAGIMARAKYPELVSAAYSANPEKLLELNWVNMIVNNLIPVTIGNIIGGAFFIGAIYWFIHLRNKSH